MREPWTCPTCAQTVGATYCSTCGERALRPRDLTLRGLFDQFAQAVTSIDGRLIRSFRCLITRPGFLTVAYLKGQRKSYTMPLQLFLIVNVLFFAAQSLVGAKIFATPLDAHLHNFFWSPVAQSLVTHRLEAKGTTIERYAPVFDQAVALNAKSLIVLMVLPFAALPPIVFFRSRRPFVAHVVFSLHFYTFLLVLFCITCGVIGVDLLFGGSGLDSQAFDRTASVIEVAVCAVYLYLATGIVYGGKAAIRMVKVVPLVLAAAGIVLGYRFLLLLITLYTA